MKLETAPETSRAASGVIGVKMIITEMANCGERGEKGRDNARFFDAIMFLLLFRNSYKT